MRCYRIVHRKYAEILSGEGARLFGGRWNTKGNSLIYTAQTSSLAMLEMLVQRNVQVVGIDYFLMTIEIPEKHIAKPIPLKELPLAWNEFPPNTSSKEIGDRFINQNKHLVLPIASVVNPLELNYLINDYHPSFKEVRLVGSKQILFDPRLG